MATAATHQLGREADIFKAVVWHSIILAAIVGLMTLLQAYVCAVHADGAAVKGVAKRASRQTVSMKPVRHRHRLLTGVRLRHCGEMSLRRLSRRLDAERLEEEQAGAAHEAAVGDVEDWPVEQVVPVQEIADAVEDEAVVEVAEGAGEDEAERGTPGRRRVRSPAACSSRGSRRRPGS